MCSVLFGSCVPDHENRTHFPDCGQPTCRRSACFDSNVLHVATRMALYVGRVGELYREKET